MANTTEPAARTWTLAEARGQEDQNAELERRVEELRAKEPDLSARIAELQADGQDASGLRAERAEARALREDIEATLPHLRRIAGERKEAALLGEAERRLLAVARAHGSLRASYAGDLAKIDAAADAVPTAVEQANARSGKMQSLEVEVLAGQADIAPKPAPGPPRPGRRWPRGRARGRAVSRKTPEPSTRTWRSRL